MIETITHSCSISRVSNLEVAAQTDINSSLVDLQGLDGVAFVVSLGSITTGGTVQIKLQQGSLSNGSDMSDIADSLIDCSDAQDNKLVALELRNVGERYVRCVVVRNTEDSSIDSIIAVTYGKQSQPVTQSSTHVVEALFDDRPEVGAA